MRLLNFGQNYLDTDCFFVFKNKEQRDEFVEKTKGMLKIERETIYQEYLS